MLSSTEQRVCPSCQRETNHVVVLVDKSFGKQPKPEQKRTAFIKDFITGWAAAPFWPTWIALNATSSVKIAEIKSLMNRE
ncbi:hypothetical protein ACK39B_12485 [Aeromonas veronii]